MKIQHWVKAVLLSAGAVSAFQAQAADKPAATDTSVDEVIVTGVFSAKAIEDAPISISAVSAEELAQQVATSSADLLRNVPGVFVNSSLGEIRNVVFSRGVSADSLDGSGGYFYVSMQEDGLPVEPVTSTNFGPDFFLRPDIMLDRLEALRGGTATVTGTNAPGGIFNYISRTGKSNPGAEIQAKYGLEGDGRNPYVRADVYAGGQLSDSTYYAVGGFYRKSDGARDPGYAMNKGGQIRANLVHEYDGGSVRLDVKLLDDSNGWFEFLPATNFKNPKIAAPFTNYDSVLPPANGHSFTNPDGSTGSWNGKDLVNSKSQSFGVTWEHQLNDTIKIQNRARYTDNRADWNTGAVIFPVQLDEFIVHILMGTFGIPGTTTYKFHGTNNVAAQVQSFSGFDHTVTVNNMPNQSVLQNGVLTQLAFDQNFRSKSWQDQITLSADLGAHQIAAGAFISHTRMNQSGDGAGFGLSPLASNPQMFDVTHTLPSGAVLQVTDPAGFTAQGSGLFDGDGYGGTQKQLSFFLGDNWQVSDALSADIGVRHESIKYDLYNLTLGPAAAVNGGGGTDNNPATLWDNNRNTFGATTYTKRDFSFWNFTGAVNYKFNDNFQAYVRYTDGQKAADFGLISGIDSPDEISTVFPKPQKIQQLEIGIKYNGEGVRLAAFPFYSKLSNVGSAQIFTDAAGRLYSPAPVFGQIRTFGVEFNGDIDLGEQFNVRTAITLQDPKASKFGLWVHDTTTNNPANDVKVITPSGDADNNPKVMARTTGTWTASDKLSVFLTHNYTGKRAANRENAWYMPSFYTFDLGASFNVTERIRLQANVNNLTNEFGVMSWGRAGGFFASLDRQGLTKAAVAANPNQSFTVVAIQPRSYWLSASVKF